MVTRPVTIQTGSTVLSDPVALDVAPLSDLAIDLYLPGDSWGSTSPATMHSTGLTTSYLSATGNHSGGGGSSTSTSRRRNGFYLSRVDVWTPTAPGAIVTMGDSITDGTGSTVDSHRRWPDFLARRLAAEYGDAAPGVDGDAGPRTAWGAPDLGGVWDFRTLTPLERPVALGEQAVLTPEEAAGFRAQALDSRNADRRDGGAARDVERAYNDFWWDYGDNLTEDLRTSLIVDPPDGRIPPRVAGVDDADQARRAAQRRPVRERVVFGSPAHGPEDLGLSERCMLPSPGRSRE